MTRLLHYLVFALGLIGWGGLVFAEDEAKPEEEWDIHGQSTIISQRHPAFHAPYFGANSLKNGTETKNSITGTLFLGTRLGRGGELYFDPEVSFGRGLSGVLGLAGFPNGEIAKVGKPDPTFYTARFFYRYSIGFGGESVYIDPDQNQLAGKQDASRLVVTLGKLSALDIFDDNNYTHEPRSQFINWALVTNGAWDFPADARGYTQGIAAEWINPVWSARFGAFMMPAEANGLRLDPRISKAHGEVVEIERKHSFDDLPGSVKLLAYANHAHMGSYREAIDTALGTPDVTRSRAYRTKRGAAVNLEQKLRDGVGAFLRAGYNDGKTESWAYTEIDRSLSFGLSVEGKTWSRPQDVLGVAFVQNGLSQDHRNYLDAGGMGFIVGDGRLNYATEKILETFYSLALVKTLSLSLDYQRFANPAYNKDRGPVDVFSLRLHCEF